MEPLSTSLNAVACRRPNVWRAALLIGGTSLALLALSMLGAASAEADATLTVSVVGKGDVTGPNGDGSDTGINCNETGGPDCSEFYPDECETNPDPPPPQFCTAQTVELTAGPDRNGYVFDSWSANCSPVTARTCEVTMLTSRTVTATFRDNAGPSVTGLTPSGGFRRGTINLAANANDNSGTVDRVEFRVRGVLRGTDTSAPYQGSFDSTALADGPATIRATAFDGTGNTNFAETSITIDNTAPTLNVTSGPDGQTFGPGTTQQWSFTASDVTSGPPGVQCSLVTAGSPASFGACSPGGGSHSVSSLGEGATPSPCGRPTVPATRPRSPAGSQSTRPRQTRAPPGPRTARRRPRRR